MGNTPTHKDNIGNRQKREPNKEALPSSRKDLTMRRERSKSRAIGILILLLFLASLANQHPTLPLARANPSTIMVPTDFTKIQLAINAANPGDTILVSSGTYNESLTVTKSLNLIGASANTTIIDALASGPGVNITDARSVYVSGFTVRNTGQFDSGILISGSANITISQNRIEASNVVNGTYIASSNSSTIRDNVITGNSYGITIQGGFGNLVQTNNVTGNSAGDIGVFGSSGNKIVDNTFRKSQSGLDIWYGSTGNIVARNIVANDTEDGLFLRDSPSNLIIENRIEFNNAYGYTLAVNIQNSTNNRFYHNNLLNNTSQIFAVDLADIASNNWDNATGSPLKTDSLIKFVDNNNNGSWDFNETVVYDKNNDSLFDTGDQVIGEINGTSRGTPPIAGTILAIDSRIKFIDLDNSGVWERGDPVVYDTNGNNMFDPGEAAIAAVGGNYWGDYPGLDNGNHGFAGDGIGDTLIPHPCPNGGSPCALSGLPAGVDWYPLMTLWRPTALNVTALAKPLGGYATLTVSFAGSAEGGVSPYAYRWSFGDGAVSALQNVMHTYVTKGTYIATLTVRDVSSTTGSSEVSITVLAPVGNLVLSVVDLNMRPVPGANVSLVATPPGQRGLSKLTSSAGTATFASLSDGSYVVQASSPGYQTLKKSVTVALGQTTIAQLIMAPVVQSNSFPAVLLGGVAAGVIATVAVLFLFFRRRGKRGSGKTIQPSR